MLIENIPQIYTNHKQEIDLFLYDLKMEQNSVKEKVNLTTHMFSFLQNGEKQIHFAETSVKVDKEQSLLLKKGNCIWSELIDNNESYYCRLLFFSENLLKDFLDKNFKGKQTNNIEVSSVFFVIENDHYIKRYLSSLSSLMLTSSLLYKKLLSIKFEELLVYLLDKYGKPFENYLFSLISEEVSVFTKVINQSIQSNLSLEEIAFLCNMSLSTFKRKFIKEYGISPGKWIKEKRLLKAKKILANKEIKPSDIYLDFGYKNFSNFSIAFKKQFGINPSEV